MARTLGGYKITNKLLRRSAKKRLVAVRLRRLYDAGQLDESGQRALAKLHRWAHRIFRPDLRKGPPPTEQEMQATREATETARKAWSQIRKRLKELEAA